MAKKHIRYTNDHQAELGKLLRELGYRHGLWQVFRDFVAMCALAISNAVDKRQYAEREAEYMKIVGRYTKEEADMMARGLAHVTFGLEAGMCDFLGSLFMNLELGDSWKGQFFTPYEVSYLMAAINMGDRAPVEIEKKGFITLCDPCVGGGAMVIAAAHALQDAKINYQQHMHAVAVDIDIVAVQMAYVQLSLLHIPAVVYHGNSLTVETWSTWRTPAHVLGFWDVKLRRAGDAATLTVPAAQPSAEEAADDAEAEAPAPAIEAEAEAMPAAAALAPSPVPALAADINLRGQLALF
ncbi:N-6 DNA methylase [Burkholderia cenocepacia]|uniref:N-6 DNA methylase n=1 Tax=Burkholderia cenocepacia TaxID=95486 RepID=UPI002230C18D|nr:N-6 DNA methylase [Burkholderia cenocepacia]MCW3640622.1 N-6 DNA methylase [Burkholderia cenocepacia]